MAAKRFLRWIMAVGIAAVVLCAMLVGARVDRRVLAGQTAAVQEPAPQSSFLFRFDPASQTFYTYPLPLGSLPYDVEVTGTHPTHVWVTEYGRNQVGHFVYTSSSDVSPLTEYPVTSTANSGPFRLTLDGNFVWFTERGANRIGRLNATTGEIVEFFGNGLSSNSGLADIHVAPDGWVWATGQSSNRLIQLVVNSPSDYTFHEYTHTLMMDPFALEIEPGIGSSSPSERSVFLGKSASPEGENAAFSESLRQAASYQVWFTAPHSVHRVGRFTPSQNQFLFPQGYLNSSTAYDIVFTPGYVWFSDPGNNSIDQILIGTWSVIVTIGPITQPAGLAKQSSNVFWITQQDRQGALARLTYTSTTQTRFDSYALPTPGLRPTEVTVASDEGIWFAALAPFRTYLPLLLKS